MSVTSWQHWPGLPRVPAANSIHVDEDGLIQGLF